ncbi:MAG: hypothetical protein A2288_02025 [Candidatus Moranbacteria bacterium RIFOXYA12_FULL_44_15]|nr:MAG: hypothetical protein A2288_02025 [Candidatus Moranbacteria bacterium RIFOXYA12_FULL_44_15]
MEKKTITIGINASFARKPNSGIGQVTLNFLRKLSELKVKSDPVKLLRDNGVKKLKVILYLEEDLPKGFKLPKNPASSAGKFTKKIFLPVYKRDDLIRKIWWEKFSLPRQIEKDQCDIFISLYQCPTILKNIPHLMLVHDIIPKLFPEYLDNARKELYWRLTERAIKKADKIFSVSKHTEKDLVRHLNIAADKISTNHIDVDEIYKKTVLPKESARFLKKYKLKPGYLLAGGGYETRKNVESVVRAYKHLLKHNKNSHFVPQLPCLAIYGKILPPTLSLALDINKLLRELNLTEHVKLLDMVPQKDMPAIFSNASMFVYPSRYEGFGMPPLEALNAGAPVIVSKVSSLPEVCGDAALYCRADDPKDIAMVIRNVLLNKDLRETLIRRGRERAKNFSWEKFTEKVVNSIENLN